MQEVVLAPSRRRIARSRPAVAADEPTSEELTRIMRRGVEECAAVQRERAPVWDDVERMLHRHLADPTLLPLLCHYAAQRCSEAAAFLAEQAGCDIYKETAWLVPGLRFGPVELAADAALAKECGVDLAADLYADLPPFQDVVPAIATRHDLRGQVAITLAWRDFGDYTSVRLHTAGYAAHWPREEATRRAVEYFLGLQRRSALWLGCVALRWPFPLVRLWATAEIAGWARAGLSRKQGELRRAISAEAESRGRSAERRGEHVEDVFRDELLAEVLPALQDRIVEWADTGEPWSPDALRRDIAHRLAHAAPIRGKAAGRAGTVGPLSSTEGRGAAVAIEEEFSAVEWAHDLDRARRAAGLSEQQARILELEMQGMTGGEIARQLDTSANAVSVQKGRIKKKLRAAG
ncbi:MAG TPA: LuxR C-terminal-related transcriptional regulator [Thermomicrobiales bacterium]|nr:LuxR C-terminal-related transcriptional regulator [Thermomicrobiales bacterium]